MTRQRKVLFTMFISGLSIVGILIAWSPHFVAQVPVDNLHSVPEEYASLFREFTLVRSESIHNALIIGTLLVGASLLVSLAAIWFEKTK